jgi:hypothetical protein
LGIKDNEREVAEMKAYQSILPGCVVLLIFFAVSIAAAETISSVRVKKVPVVDGSGNDAVWKSAQPYTVKDVRTGKDISLKVVHTKDKVFFLVQYPDATEDRLHKPWVWDKKLEVYAIGPQREDTFTFKWNMDSKEKDLSNFSDDSYTADIWYWKAHRTDPVGYADDKRHILSDTPGKKAKELTSRSGKKRYLMRLGDKGKSAQKKQILSEYKGDVVAQYKARKPEGSRADIKANGTWRKGIWTIEFGRNLKTGNADDIQFMADPSRKYLFGVSIAGLYGESVDNKKALYYGQGRISNKLYLVFK